MNDHAGWTKDGKCVLCGSDNSFKPCSGLPEDVNVKEQINFVKGAVKKICEENLIQDHQCKGVIPNTFIICGEGDFQYCSDACLNIAKEKADLEKSLKLSPSFDEKKLI